MKLKRKCNFIRTSARGWALRIALQDPALHLDLSREALGFCLLYRRLNATAFSLMNDAFFLFVGE